MHIVDLAIALSFWFLGFLFLFNISFCASAAYKKKHRPSLSIIIPAKNEEYSLPILLASLESQHLENTEITVVVDESDEPTLQAARTRGVKAIPAPPMPEGWLGKPWACYQGALEAVGDVLLFLDADTRVEENGLRKIADTCVDAGGAISVQPYHRTERLYEEFSSFFNIIGMAGMGTFTVLGNRVRPVGLFGPCVAVKRDLYFDVGGHAAVKGKVVEDLALGEVLKKQNHTINCFGGKGTISYRMYPGGLRQLIDGWSKGFATGAVKTYLPILVATILWIGGGISATRYLIEALSQGETLPIMIWGATYLAYCTQVYWMLFRIGSFKLYTALFYPISLVFFILVFLYSVFLIFIRRSVRWKGVKVDLRSRGQQG